MTARQPEGAVATPVYGAVVRAAVVVLGLLCAAPGSCGGGGDGGPGGGGGNFTPPIATNPAAPTSTGSSPNLTAGDVNTAMLQAINEANARGAPATIAVVDRVGNVLSLTQMPGAPTAATITSMRGITNSGLEGTALPTTLAAIAKALTAAYLSSNGNAFTTRTANQIIQEHFNPGVRNTPAGPLFGVQISQLACSDFTTMAATVAGAVNAGPHRSPAGFSADSGGIPLYKNGVLAGAIGVISRNTYSLDLNIFDIDTDNDELIAIAGQVGFEPPAQIIASNIAVNGLTLRYTDASTNQLAAPVSASGSFTPLPVPGYFAGPAPGQTADTGLVYGSSDGLSGIAPDGAIGPTLYPGVTTTAYVFTDGAGHVRFPPTTGLAPAGIAITADEAQALETSALNVAYSARAAIRVPTNSFAQVTVSIVDLDGNILAMARTPDAPVFGADVSLQKARSAVFFSRTDAAAKISAIPAQASTDTGTFADYIQRAQALIGPGVFADGIAWSEVAIGDISRPFFPDGIDGNQPGPLSLRLTPPPPRWSIFSTGLQIDLIAADILVGTTGAPAPTVGCANTGLVAGVPTPGTELPAVSGGKTQLANGLQIFSGGTPLYRGGTLVGAIGVSGDGIQQDSMIAFLGVQNGPSSLNNAPANIRADQLAPEGIHLRFVNCPAAPFLTSRVQNPC